MRPRVAVVGTGVAGLTCTMSSGTTLTSPSSRLRRVRAATRHRVHRAPRGRVPRRHRLHRLQRAGLPGLVRLLAELDVVTKPSDMSFSVADEAPARVPGTSFSTVFAQRRNLARPAFLRMLGEVHASTGWRTACWTRTRAHYTLRDMLARAGGRARSSTVPGAARLVDLVGGPDHVTDMPASTLARFFDRHGLLSSRQARLAHVAGGAEALRRRHLGAGDRRRPAPPLLAGPCRAAQRRRR